MTGAQDAIAQLGKACSGAAQVEHAFESFQAVTDRMAFGDPDLVERMRDVASLVLAAEDLEAQAKSLAAAARDGLATVMSETGCANLKLPHHTVVAAMKPPGVIITDATLIPPTLMVTPEPKPNISAIRQFLSQGQRIPGAELSNAGMPILSIRSSRK